MIQMDVDIIIIIVRGQHLERERRLNWTCGEVVGEEWEGSGGRGVLHCQTRQREWETVAHAQEWLAVTRIMMQGD